MPVSRRKVIKKIMLGSAVAGIAPSVLTSAKSKNNTVNVLRNNIHQSACYWCYQSIPLDDFCAGLRKIGLTAIDLLQPEQFPVAQKHGLYCPMCYGGDSGIYKGWSQDQYHETMIRNYTDKIPVVAKAGFRNVICFSGIRNGMDDETGLRNCVKGLKKILPVAEKNNVIMVMELLNSKIDHPDYMCDHTAWGVELCKRLDSENFKLLYDIYHMQIMEGDIIRTITENHQYIAHYHTGGVPGRHEIDHSQELFYPAVMRAILKTGFTGHVAQEFVPTPKDNAGKMEALEKCVEICDV